MIPLSGAVLLAAMAACPGPTLRIEVPPAAAPGPVTATRRDSPHYRLSVRIDPATGKLDGQASITWRRDLKQPLRVALHPGLALQSVRVDGQPSSASPTQGQRPAGVAQARLHRVTTPASRDGRTTLELSWAGRLPAAISEGLGISPSRVELAGQAAWYPHVIGLGPFTAELKAQLPPGYHVVTGGHCDAGVCRTSIPAHDIVLLAARGLQSVGGDELTLLHTRLPHDRAHRLVGQARRVLAYFRRAFGETAGEQQVRVVLSPRGGSGYARPGLVVLPEQLALAATDDSMPSGLVHELAHELAHLWWNLADPATRHGWIDGALAEYSALRVSSALFGPREGAARCEGYLNHLEQQRPPVPLIETRSSSPFRRLNWRERGALMIHDLEHRVGRAALDRFLRRLIRHRGRSPLTTVDFRRKLGASLGDEALQLVDVWSQQRTLTKRWLRRHRVAVQARAARLDELRFVTDKLERVYSYLKIKQKRHRFRYTDVKRDIADRVRKATSEAEHRAALQALLARFKDGHLRLVLAADRPDSRGPAVTHRWLKDQLLLTRIARLFGSQRAIRRQLRKGLAQLGRARALIIDLRGNPGGNNQTAFDYVARLFAQPIVIGKSSVRLSREVLERRPHYQDIYPPDPKRPGFARWREAVIEPKTGDGYGGAIAVLIDRACYSSCESTALAFKQSGRARLYGQATGGGSANPITFELPHTRGKLMVPTWIFVKPNGELLEDNGVKPHVVVEPGQDALARALEDLRSD